MIDYRIKVKPTEEKCRRHVYRLSSLDLKIYHELILIYLFERISKRP
jgi:hypothetical protein